MTSETNPNYAANRAWAMAESMTRSVRSYLEYPADAQDQGRDLSALIADADSVLDELGDVRDLLSNSLHAKPDERVLAAVERSIQLEVDAVIGTEIRKHSNPEGDKWRIQQLLNVARSDPKTPDK